MQETVITSATLIPIGVGVAIIGTLVGLAWKARGYIATMAADQKEALAVAATKRDADFQKLTSVVEKLSTSVDGLSDKLDDHVTVMQSKLWLSEFSRLNPTLNVPDLQE